MEHCRAENTAHKKIKQDERAAERAWWQIQRPTPVEPGADAEPDEQQTRFPWYSQEHEQSANEKRHPHNREQRLDRQRYFFRLCPRLEEHQRGHSPHNDGRHRREDGSEHARRRCAGALTHFRQGPRVFNARWADSLQPWAER